MSSKRFSSSHSPVRLKARVSNSTGKNVQEYIHEQLKLNTNKSAKFVPDGFEKNKKSVIRKYELKHYYVSV